MAFVFSPLLFIIVMGALSREFPIGVPLADLYADDLVIIAYSLEAFDMERSRGEEVEGKCRKDKCHDLRYRPGPPSEFR